MSPVETHAEAQRVGLDAWWVVFILFLFYAVSFVDRSLIAHIVDPIRESFSLTDFEMSLILGPAFAFAYAAASFPAGWIADKFDRRIVIMLGALFWSLMTVACGLAASAIDLALARMCVAIGEALLVPASAALIADRFPPSRLATALGIYVTGAKVGTSLVYFIAAGAISGAGWLVATNAHFGLTPWQLVFVIVGLPGVFLAFLPLTIRKASVGVRRGAQNSARLSAFLRRERSALVPMVLGFLFLALPAGAIIAWLPTFMQRQYEWDAPHYGPWIGTITAVAALIALPKGLLSDWLYTRGVRDAAIRTIIVLAAISTPFAAVMFFLPNPYVFLACLAIVQIAALSYAVHTMTAIQLITPVELRGRMLGLVTMVIALFSHGLGPALIGGMTEFVFNDGKKLGAALAIVVTGGLLLSLVFFCIALPRVRRILSAPADDAEERLELRAATEDEPTVARTDPSLRTS